MTNAPGLGSKLVMLGTLLVLGVAPVRAAERPAFMNSFNEWQSDEEAYTNTIALSPDENDVYVGRDLSYNISHFRRDSSSGDLTFVADVPNSLFTGPACEVIDGVGVCHSAFSSRQSLVVSPDGRHVYGCIRSKIIVYHRNAIDGALTEGDNFDPPGEFCRLTLSQDGSELYATSSGEVQIMTRDALSGSLTEVQQIGSVPGIDVIVGVAASGDGLNIYVSDSGGRIGVLRREGGSFVVEEVVDDGIVDPEASEHVPQGLLVSIDGAQVYVAVRVGYIETPQGGAVVAFTRAPDTGRLTVLAVYRDSESIDHALWVPRSVVSNGTGTRLLVEDQYAMALFERDPATGALTFLGREDPYCVRVGSFHGAVMTSAALDVYANASGGTIVDYQIPRARVMHYRIEGLSCPPEPIEGGESAAISSITITNDANDSRDQLKWNWTGTDSSGSGSFAQNREGFAVCVYADSGSGPALVYESFAPAGNCWVPINDGLNFKPPSSEAATLRVNARVSQAQLKSKGASAGIWQKIRVQSKKLDVVAPHLPLPAAGATRVQFVRSDGRAWDSRYAATDVQRNDGLKFKAKRRAPRD